MITIFGKNVTYVDRGILVDHYHYKYGEEETLFIFEDSEIAISPVYNEISYFSGIITDINDEYIKFESIIRNDYIKEGGEAEILLINSPRISFNLKTDKAKMKVGQVIEANVIEVRKGTYPLVLIAEDIIIGEPMNSAAAY